MSFCCSYLKNLLGAAEDIPHIDLSLDCGQTMGQKVITFRPGLFGKELIADHYPDFPLAFS